MGVRRLGLGKSLVTIAMMAAGGCMSGAPLPGSTPPAAEARISPAPSVARCVAPNNADRMADEVLRLVNNERALAEADPVTRSDALADIAGDYACQMIEGQFFDHTDPETGFGPGERATRAGYYFSALGENLAMGQRSAAEVVQQWMDSPNHRDNILWPTWKEIGVGVRVDAHGNAYWVQEFADPVR